jgi:hypothetical protein
MTFSRLKFKALDKLGGNAGFTLIELVVVMGMFIVVIMISANAFEKITKVASQQISSSDSNIQGIVGLEIMRSDLERAGYGLPWPAPSSASVFATVESQVAANALANGIDPKAFNDNNIAIAVDPKKAPKAIQSAAATGAGAWENGRDYLVIKATSVGMNDAAKKWSYLEGTGATTSIKEWGHADDVLPNDRLITLRSITVDGKPYRELVGPGADAPHYSYAVGSKSGGKYLAPAGYQADSSDIYVAYGVNSKADHSDPGVLRAPYNRVDYYISRPADIPAHCAPGTGTLYKALTQADGLVTNSQYPLLECVADMQVIYSLDTNGDGGVDMHGKEDILSSMSAQDIRDQLKEIRVYILAQEGKKDSSYAYRSSTVQVGDAPSGRAYDLTQLSGIGNEWKNYRWKVYTIVVTPKNINN